MIEPPEGCEYCEGASHSGVLFLHFPKEWIGTKLPLSPEKRSDYDDRETYRRDAFEIELLDTQDGKIYKARTWAHYEDVWQEESRAKVHEHMFTEHYCPCHRESDAEDGGAIGNLGEDKCEGHRFVVKSITAPDHMPDVVLYTEIPESLSDESKVQKLALVIDPTIVYYRDDECKIANWEPLSSLVREGGWNYAEKFPEVVRLLQRINIAFQNHTE